MTDLETFTCAYMEAIAFTEQGPDSEYPDAKLSTETVLDICADCRSFWRRAAPYIREAAKIAGANPWVNRNPIEVAGHDFWFTRNGHGVGFWDGDWPQPYADMLDKWAEGYGPTDIYQGDDGQLYAA